MEEDRTGLDSSYILLEEKDEGTPKKEAVQSGARDEPRKRKCPPAEENYVHILTPKKERAAVYLTPVKRSKRSVINGVKAGSIKLYDNSVEVRNAGETPYISLVECFKKVEKLERCDRRQSIDQLVKKYLQEK